MQGENGISSNSKWEITKYPARMEAATATLEESHRLSKVKRGSYWWRSRSKARLLTTSHLYSAQLKRSSLGLDVVPDKSWLGVNEHKGQEANHQGMDGWMKETCMGAATTSHRLTSTKPHNMDAFASLMSNTHPTPQMHANPLQPPRFIN